MIIEAGSYKCHAISAVMITSPKKNTPGITVCVSFDDGLAKDKMMETTLWLTEPTKAKTAEILAFLGFDGTDLDTVRGECVAVVEDDPWTDDTGKVHPQSKIKWLNDPSRGGAKFAEMEPAQKQSMLSELRGLVLAQKAAKPSGDAASFDHGHNATPAKKKF